MAENQNIEWKESWHIKSIQVKRCWFFLRIAPLIAPIAPKQWMTDRQISKKITTKRQHCINSTYSKGVFVAKFCQY